MYPWGRDTTEKKSSSGGPACPSHLPWLCQHEVAGCLLAGVSWQTCSLPSPCSVADAQTLLAAPQSSWDVAVHLAPSVCLGSSASLFHMGVMCAFPAKRYMSKGSQKKKLMTY